MRIQPSTKPSERLSTTCTAWPSMRECVVEDLGRMSYREAFEIQSQLASERKQGLGVDHLLFVEHPHVITIGRNGHQENLLAPQSTLERAGIELHESDRGGDVTYHGPG